MKRVMSLLRVKTLTILVFLTFAAPAVAQEIKFVAHADPLITWMSSNGSDYSSMGAKPGLDLGINVLYYFTENYAASSGISFLSAGGRQMAIEPHTVVFNSFQADVAPGDEMIYNLRYLNIPLAARLQTNQTGPMTYFTDLGFDIRILLKSTLDLPVSSEGPIDGENARTEVYGMNAGWHVQIGLEYELSTETSLVFGLGFNHDFFDVTKDLADADQPEDRSRLNMFRFRLGVKF
jgi:hypothetical protein